MALKINAQLDNVYCSADKKELYLAIHILAQKAQQKKARTPLNISLVIDRSGSMAGDKIHYAKEACKFVIDNLESQDFVSIVIYDDDVDVLQPTTPVKDKLALKRLIDGITDRNSTNLSGGILEGYAQVKKSFNANYVNRVLLLSDGLANVGITDVNILQEIARKKTSEENIALSTFGIGADFDEILMTKLAEFGSGNYYFIESPDKIPSIFAQELQGLLSVVAQNTTLTLDIPHSIRVEKTFGYLPTQQTTNQLLFNFKDVFSEEQKVVLVKLGLVEALKEPLSFVVNLTFDNAESFQRCEEKISLKLQPTENKELLAASFNSEVMHYVMMYESNQAMEEAMMEADKGNYEKAKSIIVSAKKVAKEKGGKFGESAEMSKQMSIMESYDEQLTQMDSMDDQDVQMTQKANRMANYKQSKFK